MKNLLLICYLLLTVSVYSQWEKQTSPVTGITFRDVKFIDINTGWVVGEHIILKTADGGNTWFEQNGTMNIIYSISMANESIGYIVGNSGNIRKTTDGGSTWNAQTSGTTSDLNSVHFVNENTGWAVGADATIIKTTNGGTSWTAQTSNVTGTLRVVFFLNENIGWAGGGTRFLRTTDGGTTWTSINQFSTVRDIQFLDANNGYVVETAGASNHTYKTTDGGLTWQFGNTITTGPFYRHSIYFTDINTGYAAGYTFAAAGSNGIYKTTDGGATWTGQTLNPEFMGRNFYSIYFVNANTGWAVGEDANIYKTTNGGVTFMEEDYSSPNSFNLTQNYPNPFNPVTIINYQLAMDNFVTLKVYDILGNEVTTIVNEYKEAGSYSVEFSATNLSSGFYYYSLQAGDIVQTKKMMIMK